MTQSTTTLQQTRQLGALAQFARLASGSAPYTLGLNFRRGHPELSLSTSLQGMALALPAPLQLRTCGGGRVVRAS